MVAGCFSSRGLSVSQGCLKCVWEVSAVWGLPGWLWKLSGVQAIDKNLIRLIFINWFLFSWVGQNLPYFGCPWGVWKVPGRCLGVVWVTVDTVWEGMMCKQLINIQLDWFLLAASFSPSCLGMVKMCHILGCLSGVYKVSGGCLVVVLVTLSTLWGAMMSTGLINIKFGPV